MKKSLIIGLTTIAVTGSAIIGSSIYAASSPAMQRGNHMPKMQKIEANMTLSGVSTEVKTAFTTLQAKHKTEMDALRTQTGTTQAQVQAKHEVFKTEMDALITKYPELKTAMEQGGKMGQKNPMDSILSGLSDADKTAIKTIREEYKAKQEALRTEEKSKMDTIIAKYPDIKAKLDAFKSNEKSRNHDGGMGGGGPRGR